MGAVSNTTADFVVDAGVIAAAFAVPPERVPELMRSGAITSRCEAGIDEDAGRFRLVFLHDGRVLRLTVDEAGTILDQATRELRPKPAGGCIKTLIEELRRR